MSNLIKQLQNERELTLSITYFNKLCNEIELLDDIDELRQDIDYDRGLVYLYYC
jgi:hypothetical protein